jgi:hypothetical protein
LDDLRSRVGLTAIGRGLGRRWGVTAGVTAAFLGLTTVAAPIVFAEEAPKRALQAVTVQLGSDGAVTGLTSALVSRGEDGDKPTTRTRALNPADHAGDLPVRVTTSWRHDGHVGTDLADLEGVSGRVEINLTVQNTTTHAERFQYDAAGVARESYELVSTPMTVVASATLPKGSAAQLVRSQPGAAEPGTTNGVVGGDEDSTTVQWASLLAPPRLAPSTTFTLVQDAKDFQLPAFNLAVQPGLATDNSIARLVGDVFGGPAAVVGSENNTIGLIASVNATLAQVTDSLQTVQQTLSVNAGQVGAAATAALTATAGSVDTAMASLLADLDALDKSVGATVGSTNSRATTALDQAVRGVLDFFGTPTAAQGPVATGTCGQGAVSEAPSTTLLGQLSAVSRQLKQMSQASGDCVADLRGTLLQNIGFDVDPQGNAQQCVGARSDSLVCQLMGAGTQLVAVADGVRAQKADIAAALDPQNSVDAVFAGIDHVVDGVVAVQTAAGTLKGSGGSTPTALSDTLADLDGKITAALGQLADANADSHLGATLTGLAADARTQLGNLRTGSGSILAQAKDLAAEICAPAAALPAGDPEALRLDGLSETLVGVPCADLGGAADASSITGRLQAQADAWNTLATSLDTAAGQASSVESQLRTIQTTVRTLGAAVDGALDAQVTSSIDALLQNVNALYTPPLGSNTACPPSAVAAGDAPLNALHDTFMQLYCSRTAVTDNLKHLIDGAADDVDKAAGGPVVEAGKKAKGAGTTADASLTKLGDDIGTQLTTTADQQLEQGKAVVAAQTARLQAVQAAAKQELDAAAQEAVGSLAAQISAATTQQSAAATSLQQQLQKVLLDLGSAAQGKGLLGVMQNSAGQTGVRTTQVQETSQNAASFRGVRVAEVADAQLEQQQLARSMQAAQRYGTFAEKLPAGSTSATVFIYRLGHGA